MKFPKLENACSKYGAAMGRRDTLPDDVSARVKLCLRRLPMVDGCYDRGGAYWGGYVPGHGAMWIAWGDGVRVFVRAFDRNHAAKLVHDLVPGAIMHGVPRWQVREVADGLYAWRIQSSKSGVWSGWHGGYVLKMDAEKAAKRTLGIN